MELMWRIKRVIDPLNIMNPGKVNLAILAKPFSSFHSLYSCIQIYIANKLFILVIKVKGKT